MRVLRCGPARVGFSWGFPQMTRPFSPLWGAGVLFVESALSPMSFAAPPKDPQSIILTYTFPWFEMLEIVCQTFGYFN